MTRHAGAPKRAKAAKPAKSGWTFKLRGGVRGEIFEGPPLGPGVTRADERTLRRALEQLDLDRDWSELRDQIVPMLPRLRPHPAGSGEPVRVMLPPGILVGFGIDIGPALIQVVPELLAQWGVSVEKLVREALSNVARHSAACDPRRVVRSRIGPTEVAALQTGEGIAASLLLAPEQLGRFFGSEPGLLLAPMRDLLLRLPAKVPAADAAWIAEEFEAVDPNSLHLGAFAWDGSTGLRPLNLEPAFAEA